MREKKRTAPSQPLAGRSVALEMEAALRRKKTPPALQAGDVCPLCLQEFLDYDGLLNLACPRCGVVSGGWAGGCS